MAIGFRSEDGRFKELTPIAFQRCFGVKYRPTLRLPTPAPEVFLEACAHYAATIEYDLDERQVRNFRRKLAAAYEAPTYIAKVSDAAGFGLYAARTIRAGEMVGEYSGILSATWTPSDKKDADINPYLFLYPFKTAYAIDATKEGNAMRFVNHSSGHSNVAHLYVFQGKAVHAIYFAKRQILADEQILLNYGKNYSKVFPVELPPRWAGSSGKSAE